MKKIYACLLCAFFAVLFASGLFLREASSQSDQDKEKPSAGRSYSTVIPFSIQGHDPLIGFFDQKDGMVYVYRMDLSECLGVYQLGELGSKGAVIEEFLPKIKTIQ